MALNEMTFKVEFYLETAPGAVAADDADVRWVEAGAYEAIDVVVCEVFHHTQLFLNRPSHLS